MNLATDQNFKVFSIYETPQALIRLIDCVEDPITTGYSIQPGFYCICLSSSGNQDGYLSFLTSGQLGDTVSDTHSYPTMGQVLIFHPRLITGIQKEECFNDSDLFNFGTQNSLHLLPVEYQSALNIFSNIKMELTHTLDMHSKRLIRSNLELLLNYCERFFSRSTLSPVVNKKSFLQRLDNLLMSCFASENAYRSGIPSVAYCADELNLSANYFGALVKKETGKTAQEYIRYKLIEEATYKIMNTHKTINEIAYDFGFRYPQHFSRFFKRVVGQNPTQYRNVNRN